MFKYVIHYNFDIYLDYYKDTLITSKWIKNIIFSLLFVGIGIYWIFDESTTSIAFPIIAIVMGVIYPFLGYASLPSLKKQLHAREEEMAKTHIVVTFNDDEIVYENLTEPKVEPKTEENKVEEVKTEENKEEIKEPEPNTEPEIQRVFNLKYDQFGLIKELALSFAFYLDRQTIVIIPKECIVEGSIEDFKNFILSKANPRVIKFKKEKVETNKK